MKGLKAFFGRLADAVMQAAPIGTLTAVIVFYVIAVGYIIFSGDDSGLYPILILLALNIICITAVFLMKLSERFHKYDQDIIGKNFVGVSRKCRIFSRSLEELFEHRANKALAGFMELEESYSLSGSEAALVSFYTARCYDLMRYYPNALRYYANAQERGFSDKSLPFLTARCTGALGDTRDAIEQYMLVLNDESSPFRHYVRTDIGRMFLKRNEPEEALKWYDEAIARRQNYADALGGAAIAHTMQGDITEGQRLYREALLNRIGDPVGYMEYFKEILGSVMLEKETEQKRKKLQGE